MAAGTSRRGLILFFVAAVIVLAVVTALASDGRYRDGTATANDRPIGLYTSLPILWHEAPNLSGILDSEAPPHWALEVIADHGELKAIDALAREDGLPLAREAILILAQPRPLSPQENVALDDWVRGGGRVLLFADPMLTTHSAFVPGDVRRPQDIVLLSPILSRWGLTLHFDEAQTFGAREVEVLGGTMPVNLAGHFTSSRSSSDCSIEADGLAARCRVGAGEVIAIADAALLEEGDAGDRKERAATLDRLLSSLAGDG